MECVSLVLAAVGVAAVGVVAGVAAVASVAGGDAAALDAVMLGAVAALDGAAAEVVAAGGEVAHATACAAVDAAAAVGCVAVDGAVVVLAAVVEVPPSWAGYKALVLSLGLQPSCVQALAFWWWAPAVAVMVFAPLRGVRPWLNAAVRLGWRTKAGTGVR